MGHDYLRHPQSIEDAEILPVTSRAACLSAALVLTFSASCRRAAPRAPALAAHLQLAQAPHDFGAALQYDELSATFPLENRGTGPLELTSIEAGHECQTPLTTLRVMPGMGAKLEVRCQPVHYGTFISTLSFHSNDAQQPNVLLELHAAVTPLLASDQPLVAFELPFGAQQTEDVLFHGARAASAQLRAETPADSGLSLETVAGASQPTLRIRAQGKPVGTRTGMLRVTTGLDRPSEILLPWSCRVLGTLSIAPTNPYFDLLAPGGNHVNIDVWSSDSNFRVRSVRVVEGPFNASFSRGDARGHYRVSVTLDAPRAATGARGSLGKLQIQSSDHSEPQKEVELFAFGSANADARQ